MRYGILGAAVLAAGIGYALWPRADGAGPEAASAAVPASGETVEVALPALSGNALIGQRAFAARCAECHGPNAGGIEGAGPPLVHKYYEPGHHGDMAFVMAARRGVQSHHWRYGDMPPVDGITDAEIAAIIAFVRTVQRANGIF